MSKSFASSIEKLRSLTGLSVENFCAGCNLSLAQYYRYHSGRTEGFSMGDVTKLLCFYNDLITWNDIIAVSSLQMYDSLKLPKILRVNNTDIADIHKSNEIFKKFVYSLIDTSFSPYDFVSVVSSLCCHFNIFNENHMSEENILDLVDDDVLHILISNLVLIRHINTRKLNVQYTTVRDHFVYMKPITKLAHVCEYENNFKSGGLFTMICIILSAQANKLNILLESACGENAFEIPTTCAKPN